MGQCEPTNNKSYYRDDGYTRRNYITVTINKCGGIEHSAKGGSHHLRTARLKSRSTLPPLLLPPLLLLLLPVGSVVCNAFTMLIKFIKRTNRVSRIRIETRPPPPPPLTSIVSLHIVSIRCIVPVYYFLVIIVIIYLSRKKTFIGKIEPTSDPTI